MNDIVIFPKHMGENLDPSVVGITSQTCVGAVQSLLPNCTYDYKSKVFSGNWVLDEKCS